MTSHPVTFHEFRRSVTRALDDAFVQKAVEGATHTFWQGRLDRLAEIPGADDLRDRLKAIRSATLAKLPDYLEQFEQQAKTAGAYVHWARDAEEANAIVIAIAQQHGAKLAVKSKSMATEEIHFNAALQAAGITPVETDLGEWIIQLAGETPSHIIGPALHKTRQQIAELFSAYTGRDLDPDDILGLTAVAREALREQFLAARIGISGANMGVAETGSVVLVTNEGNGRMVTGLPPVHVAVMGIEKVCPTWDDAAVWLSLLARSSTGQPLSIYTNVITGPAREGDPDGPQEVHIILLDNGRSKLIGTGYEEILQCIRCGACLNGCPVYKKISGHAYGHAYSGPIGAVLVPLLFGLEEYEALPHASSLCGACLDVCPARIDLPRMLLDLRAEEVERGIIAPPEQAIERGVAWLLGKPRLFALLTNIGRIFQFPLVRNGQLGIPQAVNPAGERLLPVLSKKSFHDMWADLAEDDEHALAAPSQHMNPLLAALGLTLIWWLVNRVGRRNGGAK